MTWECGFGFQGWTVDVDGAEAFDWKRLNIQRSNAAIVAPRKRVVK
jgi:hypothetical protein